MGHKWILINKEAKTIDTANFKKKDIDRKKIILKKGIQSRQSDENLDNQIIKDHSQLKISHNKHKRLSQEEIEFLGNNTAKLEESKIRHKKNQAISIKNSNFLESIKGFNYSNRNDNGKVIKYPKHDSAQNNTSDMAKIGFNLSSALQGSGNMEQMVGVPMNQQEMNMNRGIPPNGVLRTDLRREDPMMGFAGSNGGSNGSGGIPSSIQQQDNEKEVMLSHPSYRHNKPKGEERNALSQD